MKYLIVVLVAMAIFIFQPTVALGQTSASQPPSNPDVPAALATTSSRQLGFRLTEWKTLHAESASQAEQEAAALKKIGCEVTSNDHGDHIDVKYRCPQWKSVKLTTEKLADQWSSWCIAKGMETVEMNPSGNTEKATVQFRMPILKTVHLHDAEKSSKIVTTLKLIGCHVTTNEHGNHIDATFNCPDWLTIALPSNESADSWKTWLDDSGFETRIVKRDIQ